MPPFNRSFNPGVYRPAPDTGVTELVQSLLSLQSRKEEKERLAREEARQAELLRRAEEQQQFQNELKMAEAERARQEHELTMEEKKREQDLMKAALAEQKFQQEMERAKAKRAELGVPEGATTAKAAPSAPAVKREGPAEALPSTPEETMLQALFGAQEKAQAEAPTKAPLGSLLAPRKEDYEVAGLLPSTREERLQRAQEEAMVTSPVMSALIRSQGRQAEPELRSGASPLIRINPDGTVETVYTPPEGRGSKGQWLFDTETKQQVWVTEDQLAAAPPGKFRKAYASDVGKVADPKVLEMARSALGGPDVPDSIWSLAAQINTDPSLLGAITGPGSAILANITKGRAYPEVRLYDSQIRGFAAAVAKSLGEAGRLTEQDIERARALFPAIGESPDTTERKLVAIQRVMDKDPTAIYTYIKGEGVMPQEIVSAGAAGGGGLRVISIEEVE